MRELCRIASAQFDDRYALLSFAVNTAADALDALVFPQMLLHSRAEHAGSLAVDDRDRRQSGHDGARQEVVHLKESLLGAHAAHINLAFRRADVEFSARSVTPRLRLGLGRVLLLLDETQLVLLDRHLHRACLHLHAAVPVRRSEHGRNDAADVEQTHAVALLHRTNLVSLDNALLNTAALAVTAFLTMFSILLRLLSPVFALFPYGNVLDGMIELTNGLDELAVLPLPRRARLTLASFLLGFGGLAVQFQVRALAEAHDLPVRGLFAAKLLHGTLAAVLTAFLFSLSPAVLTVSSPELTPLSVRFRYTLAVLFVSALYPIWGWKKRRK